MALQVLHSDSVYSRGVLSEMGEPMPGWDLTLHSNVFEPLLAAAAAAPLRALGLTVGEPLDEAMAAALRGLSLTSLYVRVADPASFEDMFEEEENWMEEGDAPSTQPAAAPPPPPQPKHTLDCRLLAGMTGLEELSASDGERLAHPEALARLPALRTLRLPDAAFAARALAPPATAHLPGASEFHRSQADGCGGRLRGAPRPDGTAAPGAERLPACVAPRSQGCARARREGTYCPGCAPAVALRCAGGAASHHGVTQESRGQGACCPRPCRTAKQNAWHA